MGEKLDMQQAESDLAGAQLQQANPEASGEESKQLQLVSHEEEKLLSTPDPRPCTEVFLPHSDNLEMELIMLCNSRKQHLALLCKGVCNQLHSVMCF